MQKIPLYQVDSFTRKIFSGNPAAVCILKEWPSDSLLQSIAAENNLSETAFVVERKVPNFELRWFTPTVEVNLCGHATLAAAHIIKTEIIPEIEQINFNTKSGELRVTSHDGEYTLDFPLQRPIECEPPKELLEGLGLKPQAVYQAEDYLVVYKNEDEIISLAPDFLKLNGLPLRGVIATAQGKRFDFVSRWFGPNVGVNEDPVTGSAHCTLTPYWAERLGKDELFAKQLSARGGGLRCKLVGDRVHICGAAVTFMIGEILI